MGSSCSAVVVQSGDGKKKSSPFRWETKTPTERINKKELIEVQHYNFEKYEFRLTAAQKAAMRRCWQNDICLQRRDICHKTMLFCIEASPKLNEIIACGRYCYRDLTKWPKLNEMCAKKFEFFDRLILEKELDEAEITREAHRSGQCHAEYSKFGLKPHFLDIFQQQFTGLLFRLKESDAYDKNEMISGFTALLSYMIDCMNVAYANALADKRIGGRNDEKNVD